MPDTSLPVWLFERTASVVSDITVGVVIVLVHVALAKRETRRRPASGPELLRDGTPVWTSQISP